MTWEDGGEARLDELLGTTGPHDYPGRQVDIEIILTDGYAHVLHLEAERRQLRQDMRSTEAVERLTLRLVSLRDRLDEARRRFGGSRQRDLDPRPLAGDGRDEQRST